MALLLPQSTLWFVAGEGGWNWGVTHYPNMWKKVLANSGIPYDILTDYDITPGNLAKYKVIFFPAGMYVQEPVYRELLAAAEAGTRIVVDSYCKQSYPRMTSLKMKYEYWWTFPKEKQDAYFAEVRGLLAGAPRNPAAWARCVRAGERRPAAGQHPRSRWNQVRGRGQQQPPDGALQPMDEETGLEAVRQAADCSRKHRRAGRERGLRIRHLEAVGRGRQGRAAGGGSGSAGGWGTAAVRLSRGVRASSP